MWTRRPRRSPRRAARSSCRSWPWRRKAGWPSRPTRRARVFGLWEPGHHIGTQVTAAPGTPAWNECMSRDHPAAKAFYERVFGYGFEDLSNDEFTYATLLIDGRPVGGLGALPGSVPAEVPSHWSTYFSVADAGTTAARVAELGGEVLGEPFDSPYGRQVPVADDQGVRFVVIAPNEQSGEPEGWEV